MALGKSKPKVPMYQEMEDTPWITRNRDLNQMTYGNINRDLNRVNVFDDAIKQQLNSVVDDWYNRSLSDFDRSYNDTMRKTLARDYNRFGTTGNASSLLSRDYQNLMSQRALADLASNRSDRYDNLIQQELSNRYKWLDTNYNYFTNSGKVTQDLDKMNWELRNKNLDRQYANDIQSYNDKNALGKTLGTLGTAVAGYFGGPLGFTAGQALTSGLFGDAQNMLGGPSGATNIDTSGLYDAIAYTGAKNGRGIWSSDKLLGDQVSGSSNGYNPFSASLGTYGSSNYDNNTLWQAMKARGLI